MGAMIYDFSYMSSMHRRSVFLKPEYINALSFMQIYQNEQIPLDTYIEKSWLIAASEIKQEGNPILERETWIRPLESKLVKEKTPSFKYTRPNSYERIIRELIDNHIQINSISDAIEFPLDFFISRFIYFFNTSEDATVKNTYFRNPNSFNPNSFKNNKVSPILVLKTVSQSHIYGIEGFTSKSVIRKPKHLLSSNLISENKKIKI